MTPHTVIWDFDGTLYPLLPYDSEQVLLRLSCDQLTHGRHQVRNILARMLIHGDSHQWFKARYLRMAYNRLYGRLLKGTPVCLLDRTAEKIAALISPEDRKSLRLMHGKGFRMLVISCGTQDLCERTLQAAGVRDCFETVRANPLRMEGDRIDGVEPRLVTAQDKLTAAGGLTGGNPRGVVAIGDGYTDIPLLDWAQYPVMMDPDRSKQAAYGAKPYYFIRSVGALPRLLTRL